MGLKKKNFVSLTVLIAFLVISVTGLLMYFVAHATVTSTLHTVFGFLFVTAALFHLVNNWRSIRAYTSSPSPTPSKKRISKEIVWVGTIGIAILLTSFLQIEPFQFIYQWGQAFRTAQKVEAEIIKYEVYELNSATSGRSLAIDVRKGPYWRYPTYAFWVEDTLGHYIETIYVTSKLAKNNFHVRAVEENGEVKFLNEPETKAQRERPEALPVWAHKYGAKSNKGNVVPAGEKTIPDAYTGATMRNSFLLKTKARETLPKKIKIMFEINHSFDWNDYYSKDRFPDDPVYSGNGFVGQPSLIYEALIDLSEHDKYYALKPVGRGHHSGKDGSIDLDLSNITTAFEIIDRAIVELK